MDDKRHSQPDNKYYPEHYKCRNELTSSEDKDGNPKADFHLDVTHLQYKGNYFRQFCVLLRCLIPVRLSVLMSFLNLGGGGIPSFNFLILLSFQFVKCMCIYIYIFLT